MKLFRCLSKTAVVAMLMAAGAVAVAQNIAVVNGKPIPRARADAFVQELVKQGQQDTPQLQALVRQELVDREILVQEAERRGLSGKPEIRFQLDNSRQQVLINALVRINSPRRRSPMPMSKRNTSGSPRMEAQRSTELAIFWSTKKMRQKPLSRS